MQAAPQLLPWCRLRQAGPGRLLPPPAEKPPCKEQVDGPEQQWFNCIVRTHNTTKPPDCLQTTTTEPANCNSSLAHLLLLVAAVLK